MEQGADASSKRRRGRRSVDASIKSFNRSVTLKPEEWRKLAEIAEDGSALKEAARIIRRALENLE